MGPHRIGTSIILTFSISNVQGNYPRRGFEMAKPAQPSSILNKNKYVTYIYFYYLVKFEVYMNIAIIFAGGVGQRMHSGTTPKQFLELYGKPILVYTLEHFQKNININSIILVSVESWIGYCQELIDKFNLTKVVAIVPGGTSSYNSISNGIDKAKELYTDDSIILIHDGVRPLINQKTIDDAINGVNAFGSAIIVSPAIETIAICKDDKIDDIIDRSHCKIAKAPQCFRLGTLIDTRNKAKKDGLSDFIDTASLMHHYGLSLHYIEGPADNIKITTPSDFYVFKAFLEARKNSEIFGV